MTGADRRMTENTSQPEKPGRLLADRLIKLNDSPRAGRLAVWTVFLHGIIIFLIVQGALIIWPLTARSVFPEMDDMVGYLVKTRQMADCFFQDCLALEDLRPQLLTPSDDPEVTAQRELAATRIFPIYHLLLSAVLLGLTGLGFSLTSAYAVIWTAAPLLFCLAFARLVSSLWGRPAAGFCLAMVAFKIFPDSGLHLVVPSNLAMALAALVWARLINGRGDAPWALIIGILALLTLHPVGRIYAVMAAALAWLLAGTERTGRVKAAVLSALILIGLSFLITSLFRRPVMLTLVSVPEGQGILAWYFSGAVKSLVEITSNIIRLRPALFGSLPIFCAAAVFGYLNLDHPRKKIVRRFTALYVVFLIALLFYGPTQPADAFLRIWIPMVVVLFGAVGRTFWCALKSSWQLLIDRLKSPEGDTPQSPAKLWPILLLALIVGYAAQMMLTGAEQVAAMALHERDRQPLALETSQVQHLLAEARPGDRTLYTSMILMPFYLTHGALDLGAVYYHPEFANDALAQKWLRRPDLRFLAAYNPTVYHPSFEGVDEIKWWMGSPDFHPSPLSRRRRHGPLSREGRIEAGRIKWLEIEPRTPGPSETLRVKVQNPGMESSLSLIRPGDPKTPPLTKTIPAGFQGVMEFELGPAGSEPRYRLVFPQNPGRLSITGLTFEDGPLNWPWSRKALLIVQTREPGEDPVAVSFDPADLLPPALKEKNVKILNDAGSSVLAEITE